MREYTNLQWPEAPFGAEQRPFGRPWDMLAAFAVDWTDPHGPGAAVPVAAATVYLRVRRHGTAYDVAADTLSIGFRANVVHDPTGVPDLLALVNRALTRARRHAVILAGHALTADLARMQDLSAMPLRGAAGVADAWADRSVKGRGLALMVDTAAEAAATGAALDLAVTPVPVAVPVGPAGGAAAGRAVLARALATGLTAAVHAGRYRWDGTFPVTQAVEHAAWDVLTHAADPAAHENGHTTVPAVT